MSFLFFCTCTTQQVNKPQSKNQLVIVDAATAFDHLWETSRNAPAEVLLKRFEKDVSVKFPAYYQMRLAQIAQQEKSAAARVKNEIEKYSQYRTKFQNTILNLRIFLPKAYDHFRQQFPDFSGTHQAYVVQSFDQLDGGTKHIDGKTYLIFGAESIAKDHKTLDFERKFPFFHHEFFHLYHDQYFKERDGLLARLWSEGLAVLAAKELNSNADLAQLGLANPPRLMPKCEAIYADLLKHVQTRLRVPTSDTEEIYFLKSSTHSWIPKRSGYCVGYKFAKWSRQKQSLNELARLQLPEVEALMDSYLREQLR